MRMKNVICVLEMACVALAFVACSQVAETEPVEIPGLSDVSFVGWTVDEIDYDKHVINVSPDGTWLDSLVVEHVDAEGDAEFFLAADDDLVDPSLGEKMKKGTSVSTMDTTSFSFMVLDGQSRVLEVWLVQWKTPLSSSSQKNSSSSSKKNRSSSSLLNGKSSESKGKSSEKDSSDSSAVSATSEASSTSSKSSVKSSAGSAASTTPTTSSSKLSSATSSATGTSSATSSAESAKSANSRAQSESSSGKSSAVSAASSATSSAISAGSSAAFSSTSKIAETQLPGSDFNARNDFWATIGNASMSEGESGLYKIKSEESFTENGYSITLTTREVSCALIGITGGWKMVTGLYFVGDYSGKTALDIYEQGYKSGTPSTSDSDISQDMTFGKPFTARPSAFELTYSYTHVANSNKTYPQKSLAYVILVGKNNEAIAVGAISDSESVSTTTRRVPLSYGDDPDGILLAGYAGTSDLTLGTGDENVASIRVLFASSAYAHIVAGGTVGNADKYRGGKNSSLTLENFKLIYGDDDK